MRNLRVPMYMTMVILTLSIILVLKFASPNPSLNEEPKNEPKPSPTVSEDKFIDKDNFKSYMDYRTITDETSAQYTLQQDASTGLHGIRYYAGLPMVAIGTGWGASVGDYIIILFENKNPMGCIVGDLKQDVHTDSTHRRCLVNGSVVEFIVDVDYISKTTKLTGSFTSIYPSPVVDIYQEVWYEDY